MAEETVLQFIARARLAKMPEEEIKKKLLESGWTAEQINQAMSGAIVQPPQGSVVNILSLSLGIGLFLLEIAGYYFFIYYLDPFQSPEAWVGGLILSFTMFPISLVSLFNSFKMRKNGYRKIGMLFLIMSILSLPVIYQVIADRIASVVWRDHAQQEKVKEEKFYAAEKVQYQKDAEVSQQNYPKWQARFEQPQKITSIIPAGGFFATLEDGAVIKLYADERFAPTLELKNFVEKELLGKEVNIKLPDYRFSKDDFPMGDDAGKNTNHAVRVLLFLPDETLLQLKFPDIVGDYVGSESSSSGPNSVRIHNEMMAELQDYQNRKPFYNK
jgi:hypothetical protein